MNSLFRLEPSNTNQFNLTWLLVLFLKTFSCTLKCGVSCFVTFTALHRPHVPVKHSELFWAQWKWYRQTNDDSVLWWLWDYYLLLIDWFVYSVFGLVPVVSVDCGAPWRLQVNPDLSWFHFCSPLMLLLLYHTVASLYRNQVRLRSHHLPVTMSHHSQLWLTDRCHFFIANWQWCHSEGGVICQRELWHHHHH